MPIGTAVHDRTFALAESLNYREWSGYYAVSAFETHHEHEYNAIRNSAALIDISPLFKYRLTGAGATRLVDRIITRDMRKVSVGQVIYTPWCDERGKVIDDGTVSRLEENTYRWTAADPSLRWFTQNAVGLDVEITDISESVAALAVQGPTSGRLLKTIVAQADIENLKYFRVTKGSIAGVPIGMLFLGGVIPGIITGLMLMMMFAFLFRRRGVVVKGVEPTPFFPALREAFWSLMTPVVLLGAMFSGIATPTSRSSCS